MLKSSIIRSSRILRLTPKASTIGITSTFTKTQFQPIRFNSSTPINTTNELQSQLPSFDAISDSASAATSQIIGEASTHWGYLQSIGLAKSWWWPPELIQHLLEAVHVSTGLPWWASIALVTVGVRALLLPLYVKSSDMMARNAKIKPELDVIQAKMYAATDMTESQTFMLERKRLLAKHGIKNRYLAAPLVQIPLALGFFSGIRQMTNYPVDGFTNQGILWFQDLSAADPYLGLQCLSAAVIMGFMRLGGETGAQQFSPAMMKIFTILPLVSIPATMSFSSGVVLYFFVNGLFSILQSFLLKNKLFRKSMGLAEIQPRPPADPSKPSEDIMESFKKNIEKAREQAEKKAQAKAKDEEQKKLAEKQRENSRIKIVKRQNIKK